MKNHNNTELFAYWESILESNGLAPIDEAFHMTRHRVIDTMAGISKDNFFDSCASKLDPFGMRAVFGDEELVILTQEGYEVWFIRPGSYSYHGLECDSHLEMKVHEEFRGQGIGSLMLTMFSQYGRLFENPNFLLPEFEYSHKKSTIALLTHDFWYEIVEKYRDGQWYDVQDEDFDEITSTSDDGLLHTYKLQRSF